MVRRHSENTLGLLNQCSEVSFRGNVFNDRRKLPCIHGDATNDNSSVVTCWFGIPRVFQIKASRVEPSG